MTTDDARERTEEQPVTYRWTCPICRESNLGLIEDDTAPESEAGRRLRSHIRGSAGDGHGPSGTVPCEVKSLHSHVAIVDA